MNAAVAEIEVMKNKNLRGKIFLSLLLLITAFGAFEIKAQKTVSNSLNKIAVKVYVPNSRPRRVGKVSKTPAPRVSAQSPESSKIPADNAPQLFYSTYSSKPYDAKNTAETETNAADFPDDEIGKLEKKAFQMLNAERIKNGLKPLDFCGKSAKIARIHSADMALRNYFSHFTPQGESVVDRARKENLQYVGIGENIAYNAGVEDPVAFAVERFMISPKHRASLLSTEWTSSGVGISRAADGKFYITQVFVRR